MKDTKIVFGIFRPYNLMKMAETFGIMAKEGWQVERINGFLTKYRKAPPRDIKYSIVYVDKSSDSELISKPSEDFVNMCEEMGWQHIITYNSNLYVFMSTNSNPPPIETDPVVQVENIRRYMKGETTLTTVMMCAYGLFPLIEDIKLFKIHPYYYFYYEHHKMFLFYIVLIAVFFINTGQNILWYKKAKKLSRLENRFVNIDMKNTKLVTIPLLVTVFLYTGYIVMGTGGLAITLSAITTIAFVSWLFKDGKKKPRGIMVKVIGCIGAFCVCIYSMSYIAYNYDISQSGSNLVQVIEDKTMPNDRWYVYCDDILLKIEELTELPDILYSYNAKTYIDNSLLTIFEGNQLPHPNNRTEQGLIYEIIKTDNKKLFDILYNDRLTQGGYKNHYTKEIDRALWHADKVLYNSYSDDNSYIITKGNTIIAIKLPCRPTEENIKTIMTALADY